MMYSKGIAIIAITRNGVETALKIKKTLTTSNFASKVYAPSKYVQEDVIAFESKLEDFIKTTYHTVSAVVGVMATGIMIRAIAPHLENKLVDPAIVGVDASGKFVISLLSGHYGGANELTTIIAQGIGATPVVTTASDISGKQSVDDLARILQLTIANPESLIPVNAIIANGDRVVVILIGEFKLPTEQINSFEIKKVDTPEQALEIVSNYDAGVIITQEALPIVTFVKPITIFRMQRITIGLGAGKEITTDQILRAITSALKTANVHLDRVAGLATAGVNQESQSMMSAALTLGFELKFVTNEVLRNFRHEDLSSTPKSEQEIVGGADECERAALIVAGKNSRLIQKSMKINAVMITLAAGE